MNTSSRTSRLKLRHPCILQHLLYGALVALLTVGQPAAFPRLVAQDEEISPTTATGPIDWALCPGGSTTFSTTASGTGPFDYQWTKDGAEITGASNSSYTVGPVSLSDDINSANPQAISGGSIVIQKAR